MEVSIIKSSYIFFKRSSKKGTLCCRALAQIPNSCIELWGHSITVQGMPRGLGFLKVPTVRLEMAYIWPWAHQPHRTSLVSKNYAPSLRGKRIWQRKLIHLSLTVIQSGMCTQYHDIFHSEDDWSNGEGVELGPALCSTTISPDSVGP